MPRVKRTDTNSKFGKYEQQLRSKANEIRLSLSAQTVSQLVARQECPSDEGDLSQQSHEEWIFINRNELDAKLLREVEAALHRIETGAYGICQECEEPISIKRLDAVPWARFCVKCQDEISRGVDRNDYQEADR